jgi:predicted O-methyltransferase YrrM
MIPSRNSLHDAQIGACLRRLHDDARKDRERRLARAGGGHDDSALVRMGELYLAVSEDEGRLLYLLARGSRAGHAVEFGASFGVSTVYLGAALRDNGGRLTTTEVHPDKCRSLRATLQQAGIDDVVSVLEGDARETLGGVNPPVDFVFLDGWKGMYLPVLELLLPRLGAGALIAADNIDHDAAQDYARRVRDGADFVSTTIGKMELSCHTG